MGWLPANRRMSPIIHFQQIRLQNGEIPPRSKPYSLETWFGSNLDLGFILLLLPSLFPKVISVDKTPKKMSHCRFFHRCAWPLTWFERLTHFLGALWKFHLGLWHVHGSLVLYSCQSPCSCFVEGGCDPPDAVTWGGGRTGRPAGVAGLVGGLVAIACRCCFGGPLLI